MADELRIGLSELLRKAMIEQDADFLKEGVRVLSQALMEMEVQQSTWARGVTSGVPSVEGSATATASAPGTRGLGPWN